MYEPLEANEIIKAIEFDKPRRVPMVIARWWGSGLRDQYGDRLKEFEIYPDDICLAEVPRPAFDPREDGYWWKLPKRPVDPNIVVGNDSIVNLHDWEDLKIIENDPPDVDEPTLLDGTLKAAKAGHESGRYVLLVHWGLMFEAVWKFRGMENLLADYYEHPKEVHRLHRLITDHKLAFLERAIRELKPHGFFYSDDLGSQTALLLSPKIFREFIAPYYREIYEFIKKKGLHIWLHTCGNVTEIFGDLVDLGLDVIHPIQKHAMNEIEIADRWGGKIAFLAGIDVQHTLQTGTPDDVRREVRFLMDTFDRPDGGMMIAAGNGIVSGTPFENIRAFLDESYHYGIKHRSGYAG